MPDQRALLSFGSSSSLTVWLSNIRSVYDTRVLYLNWMNCLVLTHTLLSCLLPGRLPGDVLLGVPNVQPGVRFPPLALGASTTVLTSYLVYAAPTSAVQSSVDTSRSGWTGSGRESSRVSRPSATGPRLRSCRSLTHYSRLLSMQSTSSTEPISSRESFALLLLYMISLLCH